MLQQAVQQAEERAATLEMQVCHLPQPMLNLWRSGCYPFLTCQLAPDLWWWTWYVLTPQLRIC